MTTRRAWIRFAVVALAGFIVINGYVWYLSSRIVPFAVHVPLSQTGYSETFPFCCLHPTDYVLMLVLDHPDLTSVTMLKNWDAAERELRAAFNVDLAINLRDGANKLLIEHRGGLADWKLTNSSPLHDTDGGFWKYRFDARFVESYELTVNVLKGNTDAERFRPALLLYGVDDGYFWLGVLVYNALWGALVIAGAIIGLVVLLVSKRKHAT